MVSGLTQIGSAADQSIARLPEDSLVNDHLKWVALPTIASLSSSSFNFALSFWVDRQLINCPFGDLPFPV